MRSRSEVAHIVYASIIATELGFCSHKMISMHAACMIETCSMHSPDLIKYFIPPSLNVQMQVRLA